MINNSKYIIKSHIANITKILSKSKLLNISLIYSNKNFFVEKSIVENKIKTKINCENIEVEDISGNCRTSFSIKIKSPILIEKQ